MTNQVFFIYTVLIFLLADKVYSSDIRVELSSNGPIILGANIMFNAHLFNSDGSIPTGKFRYVWQDNSLWQNNKEITLDSPSCFYNLSYSPKKYPPGPYLMQVEVYDLNSIWPWPWPETSGRLRFELTTLLNGNMQLVQGSQIQSGTFVASGEIKQEIVLSKPDFDYLNETATSIRTLWFLDCNLIGNVTGYNITTNFTHSEESHSIEAIVVARFDPKPTPPPPTPTPNITTTTPKPTTNQPPNSTVKTITKRDVTPPNKFYALNISRPFSCNNKSLIIPSPNETYGYFERNITVKAPIENVTISGNNWLQHGELLRLNVSCTGSAPIRYCLIYENGIKNATGNETCDYLPAPLDTCKFHIYRYFRDEEQHTIFIILYNDVTKVVKPVAVTIYKAIHHPQLSVIVVPVSFSLVAVVLIVFGVAYYVQSRNRFIVEVADFDFGQQYAEMEYKTFGQRLGEAFSETYIGNLLYQHFNQDKFMPNGNAGSSGTSGFKYGSMT